MREIKFKGKCIETGEWVYGFYLKTGPFYHDLQKHVIAIPGKVCDYAGLKFVEVIPETIGQFTGLHDKNGQEIYEKDICKCPGNSGKIEFLYGGFYMNGWSMVSCLHEIEIIGNISENKSLIEKE